MLGASANASETLLLLGKPDAGGIVHVRRWTADNWSAPVSSRADRAPALLEWIEAQSASGRTMNQSMYTVRRWLRGEGSASR